MPLTMPDSDASRLAAVRAQVDRIQHSVDVLEPMPVAVARLEEGQRHTQTLLGGLQGSVEAVVTEVQALREENAAQTPLSRRTIIAAAASVFGTFMVAAGGIVTAILTKGAA